MRQDLQDQQDLFRSPDESGNTSAPASQQTPAMSGIFPAIFRIAGNNPVHPDDPV
jgi:hypothetical protein